MIAAVSQLPLQAGREARQVPVWNQAKLDLTARSRTSRLPWRGQFSPELVEYLLSTVCSSADVVFDPFCGSGTVLFEAARRGIHGIGIDVNPAAWHLASLVSFCAMPRSTLGVLRHDLRILAHRFSEELEHTQPAQRTQTDLRTLFAASAGDPMLESAISAAVLLGMRDRATATPLSAASGFRAVEALLDELAAYPGSGSCYLSDARSTAIEARVIEAVITSPPYINVFNYHQNYRPAVELLGWHPLEAARCEVGSNRKHRGNRFLTVVQYCLDMAQALNEIARVCRLGAPVVLVVGRESSVLGTPFHNGALLERLMGYPRGQFEVIDAPVRCFTNRFGERIYEQLVVGRCQEGAPVAPDYARSIAIAALEAALRRVSGESRASLEAAIASSMRVEMSPALSLTEPAKLNAIGKGSRVSMQVSHPKTHGDKLLALRGNRGLPLSDRNQVESAVERYHAWIAQMKSVDAEGRRLLEALVAALDSYKTFIDLDLIYDSEDSFLYRQNGQTKLSNSVLEEFLPYLFDVRLVPGFRRLSNVRCGPQASFAGLSFGSPFLGLSAGGVFLKTKNQDFAVSKSHRIIISDASGKGDTFTEQFSVSHFATEIKTNLDKTMFQEASQSANELKRAVPGSRCVVLCEYLDMTPITTKLTSIDEVIVLRKAKRLGSNIRHRFRTTEGRRNYRQAYVQFLRAHPLQVDSFARFVDHLNECFPEQGEETLETVLKKGYF